jgi:hypothetical protein
MASKRTLYPSRCRKDHGLDWTKSIGRKLIGRCKHSPTWPQAPRQCGVSVVTKALKSSPKNTWEKNKRRGRGT